MYDALFYFIDIALNGIKVYPLSLAAAYHLMLSHPVQALSPHERHSVAGGGTLHWQHVVCS